MSKKFRRSGPSPLVAGLQDDIENAQRDRARPEEIPELLDSLRRGDPGAQDKMRAKFRYTMYEASVRKDGEFSDLGTLFVGLATAIDRLAKNTKSDAEKFILDELQRSKRRQFDSESRDIRANESTNTNRKKRGKSPYRTLVRVDSLGDPDPREPLPNSQNNRLPNKLEDSALETVSCENQEGKFIDSPDALHMRDSSTRFEEVDLRLDLTCNSREADVLELLLLGWPVVRIAESIKSTRYAVETIISAFRDRAERLGSARPEARKNEMCTVLFKQPDSVFDDAPTPKPETTIPAHDNISLALAA
jgi:hypothetical protein